MTFFRKIIPDDFFRKIIPDDFFRKKIPDDFFLKKIRMIFFPFFSTFILTPPGFFSLSLKFLECFVSPGLFYWLRVFFVVAGHAAEDSSLTLPPWSQNHQRGLSYHCVVEAPEVRRPISSVMVKNHLYSLCTVLYCIVLYFIVCLILRVQNNDHWLADIWTFLKRKS